MSFNATTFAPSPLVVTLAPTLTPSTLAPSPSPSPFACVAYEGDPNFPFICYPTNLTAGYGVDAQLAQRLNVGKIGTVGNETRSTNLYPLFLCTTDSFDDVPSHPICSSFCVIQYQSFELGSTVCSSCALRGDDLSYDCRNLLLLPDIPDTPTPDRVQQVTTDCAVRDTDGVCNQDYQAWVCNPEGLGYACFNTNRNYNTVDDPIFPFDTVTNMNVVVYCVNDITGLPVASCQQPRCNLAQLQPRRACGECRVANTNASRYDFSYDCELLGLRNCPILNEQGECVEPFVQENVTNLYAQGIPNYLLNNIGSDNQDDDTGYWTWTLQNINPTQLNVISDLLGYASRTLFGVAFAMSYPLLMTWQVLDRRTPVSIKALGGIPDGLFHAFHALRLFAWSLPAFCILGLFLIADFSHTLADSGFASVVRQEPGAAAPVFVISNTIQNRNLQRSFQTAGDPDIARTTVLNVANVEGRINLSRDQTDLKTSFLNAVASISRGNSPFILEAIRPYRQGLRFAGQGSLFETYYMPDNSPIVAMDRKIPLECTSTSWATIEEVQTGFPVFDDPKYNTVLLPNCTFSSTRPSGIYGDSTDRAEILEVAAITGIAPTLDGADTGEDVVLKLGNSSAFQTFTMTPDQKRLARDRPNWEEGRVVEDLFDTLQIGNATQINLGRIVMATGGVAEYGFFAEVKGTCPDRPSGLSSADTACLVFLQATCDSFEEDRTEANHPIYSPITSTSQCELGGGTLVWGRNFVVDTTLTSVVGGLYGQVRPTQLETRVFAQNSLLAGLFLMGIVEELPKNESVARAQVRAHYVFFMILPFGLSLALVALVYKFRQRVIPLPLSAWDLMVLGREQNNVPERPSKSSAFPEAPDNYVLYFFDAHEGVSVSRLLKNGAIEGEEVETTRHTAPSKSDENDTRPDKEV